MDEEERIRAEAKWQEAVDQRLKSLEGKAGTAQWVLFGALATIFSTLWEKLSAFLVIK